MIAFDRYKVLSFDCYGTLIDWETGIEDVVRPWLAAGSSVPLDLVITCFALHQAKHQQTRPTLLYPEVLRRTWRDIEGTFGWDENGDHAGAFAASVPAIDWNTRSTGEPERIRPSVVVTCASTQACVGISSLVRISSSIDNS